MAEIKEENTSGKIMEDDNLKVEIIEHAGKKWTKSSLVQLGIMIFVTFVVCTLFFFAILRFDGFAEIWSKIFRAASANHECDGNFPRKDRGCYT